MKNHILAMKKQQEDMDKKIKFLKHKEENIINVKKDRENTKKPFQNIIIIKKMKLNKKEKILKNKEKL